MQAGDCEGHCGCGGLIVGLRRPGSGCDDAVMLTVEDLNTGGRSDIESLCRRLSMPGVDDVVAWLSVCGHRGRKGEDKGNMLRPEEKHEPTDESNESDLYLPDIAYFCFA